MNKTRPGMTNVAMRQAKREARAWAAALIIIVSYWVIKAWLL